MANVAGWSQEMDRKLDLIERDPGAYFDDARDGIKGGARSSLRQLLSTIASTLTSLLGHR